MTKRILAASLLPALLSTGLASAAALPHSTPEAQGIPSSAILALVEALEKNELGVHSLMVVRRGQVVAEGAYSGAS